MSRGRDPAGVDLVSVDQVPVEEILTLVRASLGPGGPAGRSAEWWRWKHQRSPFGPSYGLVAMAGGRPVALRVFLRWRFQTGGRKVEAVRAVDTATHPDWRRRGLFRRLTMELAERAADAGAAFVFNTPNAKSRPGYLSMGWRPVARVPVLTRPLRPLSVVATIVRRSSVDAAAPPLREGPPGSRPVSDLLARPWLADFLTAAVPADEARLHTVATPEYLNWRYAAVPGVAYGALWQVTEGQGAVVVARIRRRRNLIEVAVVEVLTTPGQAAATKAVGLIRRLAAEAGADYLIASAPRRSAERRVLRASGLWGPLPGPRLVARPLATGAAVPSPLRWPSWRLGLGDLELF